MPTAVPLAVRSRCASSITSSKVATANRPSYSMRAERKPFPRAQGLDFGEREVLGEPPGHRLPVDGPGALAIRKPLGDVGGAADFVLVAGDEHAVLGRDEIGLDEIRAHLDREAVGLERVLGPMAAGAAVADDQRGAGRRGCRREERQQHQAARGLPQQLESELELPRIEGGGDRPERAGAAIAVRRPEIRVVQRVEGLDADLQLRRAAERHPLRGDEVELPELRSRAPSCAPRSRTAGWGRSAPTRTRG